MIDLGDKIAFTDDVTATVTGWRRMLGGVTEWQLTWWDGGQMIENWMNEKMICAFKIEGFEKV